ncbi:MAG TPA: hypothetical protein VFW07_07695 [Parafilimonas sp.]|nr:hypothetical protein [Parafilimonas sp.]
MKRTLRFFSGLLFALLIGSALTAVGQLGKTAKKTTNNVCFNDGFYNWKIKYTDQGGGMYSATGTVNVDGVDWKVYGWGDFAGHKGTVEFHAGNPNADACAGFYVDSFTYFGNAQITGTGKNTTFTGNGNWVSYCADNVLGTGTWGASGPCSGNLKYLPYGPAKSRSSNFADLKKTTNSVCFNDGFSDWKITYTDKGGGNYSVKGSLDVDGSNWIVYGWGNFVGHKGSVELHASNPNPDGCNFYSDSFTYKGNAQITGNGKNTTFNGSGNWTSYCFGGVLSTGTWAASGPCGSGLKYPPFGPAKHGEIFSMKVSPNPLKSASTVTYNLAKDSRVNIAIYNYMQQPVKQIVNKTELAGKHSYVIDGSSLTNGVYRVVAVVEGKTYSSNLQVAR